MLIGGCLGGGKELSTVMRNPSEAHPEARNKFTARTNFTVRTEFTAKNDSSLKCLFSVCATDYSAQYSSVGKFRWVTGLLGSLGDLEKGFPTTGGARG